MCDKEDDEKLKIKKRLSSSTLKKEKKDEIQSELQSESVFKNIFFRLKCKGDGDVVRL